MIGALTLFFSIIVAGLAGPIRHPIFSFISSFLFLPAMLWALDRVPYKKYRKTIVFITSFAMTLIQFRWGLTHPYWYILIPWLLFSFIYAIQWVLLISIIDRSKNLPLSIRILIPSFSWIFLEYSRHFLFSGFSFYPWGLHLTFSLDIAQWTSIAGIYLLSAISIASQLFIWNLLNKQIKYSHCFFIIMFWVLFIGAGSILRSNTLTKAKNAKLYSVALIQPHFPLHVDLGKKHQRFNPRDVLRYWDEIYTICSKSSLPVDLIVLPEIVVPYDARAPIAKLDISKMLLKKHNIQKIPSTASPHTFEYILADDSIESYSSHLYFAKALANQYDCDVIFGVQHEDSEENAFSAAMITRSDKDASIVPFYAKRILVPMGEYIPLSFLSSLAAHYGVMDSFKPGSEATLLPGKKINYGISICYEEIFGSLVRETSKNGANLLVNISNDGWFPGTLLPMVHFEHARIRAIENRLSLVRSCNTGYTVAVYPTGDTIRALPLESYIDPLVIDIPLYSSTTLYELTGDYLILGITAIYLTLSLIIYRKKLISSK